MPDENDPDENDLETIDALFQMICDGIDIERQVGTRSCVVVLDEDGKRRN